MPTQNSLRRDIEVGMSAILLLTQLFSLLLVFLWRHVAAFRWSRGLVRDSHGGGPVVALAPVAGVVLPLLQPCKLREGQR